MSRFFRAMEEAAKKSGGLPSLPMPDVTRFKAVAQEMCQVEGADGGSAGARAYRHVAPQPTSSTVLPPLRGPYLPVADQYRIIRTKIVQHPAKPRLLVVSSSGIGDGKTVSAINIAGALAMKEGTSVLLVDADFRRPRVAEALGLDEAPGLAGLLRGEVSAEAAIIQLEAQTSLFVLPAGDAHSSPAELLDTPQWKALTKTLSDSFEYVVVDAPPVGLVADFDLIQAAVDAAILVVRIDHSRLAQCLRALKSVPKEKLLGIVINAVPDWFLTRSTAHDYNYYRRSKRESPAMAVESAKAREEE